MHYQKPFITSIIEKDITLVFTQQYTFDLSQCTAANGTDVIVVENGISEICADVDHHPPEGSSVVVICAETGEDQPYIRTYGSIVDTGEVDDCQNGDTIIRSTVSFDPAPPSYCTITHIYDKDPQGDTVDICEE